MIAFLSEGRLFVLDGPGEPREIASEYGASVRERAARIEARHAWKTQGRGAQFMRGASFTGIKLPDAAEIPIAITGLARGAAPGELVYSLRAGEVSGLFVWSAEGERRLLHGNSYAVRDVATGGGKVACSLEVGGAANLALTDLDGAPLTELTDGDSIDAAPTFAPDGSLWFQSAGIARDAGGAPVGLAPWALMRLDPAGRELAPAAAAEGFDLLAPRLGPDGTLWCLRRPYVPPGGAPSSVWADLKDLALVPFRILAALWGFLNFFSMMFTGQGLRAAGGPAGKELDEKQLYIMGNLVDAAKAQKEGRARGEEFPGLVPPTWELVRRVAGAFEVVERGVLSFDLDPSGEPVWTNGTAVFRGKTRLAAAARIEKVVAA